jgi:tripartite-type tricarboxylate transporter receptor subunit TctC
MRKTVAVSLFVASALANAPAMAQSFPTKPVRVITSSTSGIGDVILRATLAKASEKSGIVFVVEPKPGADNIIASDYVAKQPPDGYQILHSISSMTLLPHTKKDLPYDTVKDFQGLTRLWGSQSMVFAHPSLPANNLAELITYAKANPGKLDYATTSIGGIFHLLTLMFSRDAGITLTAVPFRDPSQAINAVLGGQVPLQFTVVSTALQHVQSGKLKALGTFGPKRSPSLPNAQASGEIAGLPPYDADIWLGYHARSGTPREILNRLHAALVEGVRVPEVRDLITKTGSLVYEDSIDVFHKRFLSDIELWGRVIREANLKFD